MKKYFFLVALLAMTSSVFTSCSSDDESSAVTVTLPEPATKSVAAKYTIDDASQSQYVVTIDGKKAVMKEFELTDDKGCIMMFEELAGSRAEKELQQFWQWHKFTKEGDDRFAVVGFGKIIVETKPGNMAFVSLIPDGVDEVDVITSILTPSLENKLSGFLCRYWDISQYRMLITKGQKQVGTAWTTSLDGTCNLLELIDFANKNHNAGIDSNLGGKEVVNGITFSSNGTFLINYKGTDGLDVGEWSWVGQPDTEGEKASFTYYWYDNEMGNELLGGVASVAFMDENCVLSLDGKVGKSCKFQVQFRLKQAK